MTGSVAPSATGPTAARTLGRRPTDGTPWTKRPAPARTGPFERDPQYGAARGSDRDECTTRAACVVWPGAILGPVLRIARALVYLGTVVAVLGFGKLHAVWHSYDYTGSTRFAWSIAYIAMLGIAAYGLGVPDLLRKSRATLLSAAGAAGAAALGISLLQLVAGSALLPRFVVFAAAGALVPFYAACTTLAWGGRARAEHRDRVVLVGDRREAEALRDDLGFAPERPAQLVAVLTPTEATARSGEKPLVQAVLDNRATVVALDRAAQADDGVVAQAAALHENGVRIRSVSLFYEEWLGKLPMTELERVSLMFDIGELHRARYGRVKRLFDLALATVGCVGLAALVPFVVLGNLLGNRGSLFYRQERVGRGGQLFTILKFRTMRAGDVPEGTWTGVADPRITPFGKMLRLTHLDELPQMVNILRGDLSIVGPRPEQPQYVQELIEKIPFYDLRHLVRPGLTGWAQVKYGYADSEAGALEKLQYEFWYLRHQDVLLDTRIVGRTLRTVFGSHGAGR
jgi:lipopolysaccharide/colanic/teichoic acid biosynthesis glycosyltransferase